VRCCYRLDGSTLQKEVALFIVCMGCWSVCWISLKQQSGCPVSRPLYCSCCETLQQLVDRHKTLNISDKFYAVLETDWTGHNWSSVGTVSLAVVINYCSRWWSAATLSRLAWWLWQRFILFCIYVSFNKIKRLVSYTGGSVWDSKSEWLRQRKWLQKLFWWRFLILCHGAICYVSKY